MSNKNPWDEGSDRDESAAAPATKTFKGRVVLSPQPKQQGKSARGGRTDSRHAAIARTAPARVQTPPSPNAKEGREVARLRADVEDLRGRVKFLEDLTKPDGLPPETDDDFGSRSDG
jgi:hypothetical protein